MTWLPRVSYCDVGIRSIVTWYRGVVSVSVSVSIARCCAIDISPTMFLYLLTLECVMDGAASEKWSERRRELKVGKENRSKDVPRR